MKFKLTALVALVCALAGVGLGFLIPRPLQTYGMAVVTGTTKTDPAMKGYVERVDALLEKWGCQSIARERNTLRMEGNGGPLTVITACPGGSLQTGIDFYNSPEYQELVELRKPFTDWDFRLIEGRF